MPIYLLFLWGYTSNIPRKAKKKKKSILTPISFFSVQWNLQSKWILLVTSLVVQWLKLAVVLTATFSSLPDLRELRSCMPQGVVIKEIDSSGEEKENKATIDQ